MSRLKVHLVERSRIRFGDAPPDYLAICGGYISERLSPEQSTRDESEVTCKKCLAKIAKTKKQAQKEGA